MRKARNYKRVTVQPEKHHAIVRRNSALAQTQIQQSAAPKEVFAPIDSIPRIHADRLAAESLGRFTRNYKKVGRIDPILLGETVYIVGGGPSLNGFDFSTLDDKYTIAVNKSFLSLKNPTAIYWSDYRVFRWYQNEILQHQNTLKVTNKPQPDHPAIINLLSTGKHGLEKDPHGVRDGGNSGYAAINLAYHLGAKKIILLGFDMKTIEGKSHYHEGYEVGKKPDNKMYERLMLPSFDSISIALMQAKVKVYNASLESEIKCFQKIHLNQIFSV